MRYRVRNVNLVPRYFDQKTGKFLNSNEVVGLLNDRERLEADEMQRKHEMEEDMQRINKNDVARHNLEVDRRTGPPSTFPFASIWPW